MVTGTLFELRTHRALLDQGLHVIESLDDEAYRTPAALSPGGTIGMHFRHVLDFYAAFLLALEGPVGTGTVDYTRRERGTPVETDRGAAAARLREIRSGLAGLEERSLETPLSVIGEEHDEDADDREGARSSLGRELSFLESHTVHHYALIAMLVRARGLAISASFGVAPSTLRSWSATRSPGDGPGTG